MTWYFDVWHDFDIDRILYLLNNKKLPRRIVIFASQEDQCWLEYKNCCQIINDNNIKVHIVLGSAPGYDYTKLYPIKNMNIYYWPTYWFNYTAYRLEGRISTQPIKYNFSCMNNIARPHRIEIIGKIKNKNLHRNAFLTFHKGWTDMNRQYNLPMQYLRSRFDVVLESSVERIFITEKTVRPLLCSKPFITFAAPGFNKFLQSLGFKLYTGVDYRYDEDVDNRVDLFIESIENFPKEIDQKEIDYNKNLVYNIIKNKSLVPQFYLDVVARMPENEIKHIQQNRLNKILC